MKIEMIDEMDKYKVKVTNEELKIIKDYIETFYEIKETLKLTNSENYIIDDFNIDCFDKDEIKNIDELYKIAKKVYKKLKKGKSLKHKHLLGLKLIVMDKTIRDEISKVLDTIIVW